MKTLRIKETELQDQVSALNEYRNTTQSDQYQIGMAYGGYRLEQRLGTTSGIRVVSHDGYGTKRQLNTFLQGLLDGLNL